MKPRSKSYDYHGLQVFYRLENRKEAPTFSLSVYDTWSTPGQYLHPVEKLLAVSKEMRDKSEEEILLSLIPTFLRRAFPAPTSKVLSDKEKDDRSSFILHLPLAAVLDCDCEAIIAINSWKTGNANDFRRAASWLRETHPRLLLSEVIPERIAPTLQHTKSPLTDIIVWAVQYLFIYETACGHLDDNPWPSYRSARRQLQPRPRITGRSYTKLNVLPEREFNRLLRAAIFEKNKKRRGRSRYLLSVPVTVFAEEKQELRIPAKLVYVRNRNKRSEYLVLLTTDTSLTEDEVVQLYCRRWEIEVFFKTCKSLLWLTRGCRSVSYDAICAHTAIVFARYMFLAMETRAEQDERAVGPLFCIILEEIAEISVAAAFEYYFPNQLDYTAVLS